MARNADDPKFSHRLDFIETAKRALEIVRLEKSSEPNRGSSSDEAIDPYGGVG